MTIRYTVAFLICFSSPEGIEQPTSNMYFCTFLLEQRILGKQAAHLSLQQKGTVRRQRAMTCISVVFVPLLPWWDHNAPQRHLSLGTGPQ